MKKINDVFETNDYRRFSFLKNNRIISRGHVNKIVNSMKKRRLISPILTNEKGEIIDGQHRFLAQKELNLSIPFTIQKGYGEKETQILNTNTKNWSLLNWEVYYCNKYMKDYIVYRDFRKKYGFTTELLQVLLCGYADNDEFSDGLFKVGDFKKAIKHADMIVAVGSYFRDYKDRMFMRAMITCFKNKYYNHNVFLSKLSYQGNSLLKCAESSSYLRLIENIYNYKSRKNTKKLRLF